MSLFPDMFSFTRCGARHGKPTGSEVNLLWDRFSSVRAERFVTEPSESPSNVETVMLTLSDQR